MANERDVTMRLKAELDPRMKRELGEAAAAAGKLGDAAKRAKEELRAAADERAAQLYRRLHGNVKELTASQLEYARALERSVALQKQQQQMQRDMARLQPGGGGGGGFAGAAAALAGPSAAVFGVIQAVSSLGQTVTRLDKALNDPLGQYKQPGVKAREYVGAVPLVGGALDDSGIGLIEWLTGVSKTYRQLEVDLRELSLRAREQAERMAAVTQLEDLRLRDARNVANLAGATAAAGLAASRPLDPARGNLTEALIGARSNPNAAPGQVAGLEAKRSLAILAEELGRQTDAAQGRVVGARQFAAEADAGVAAAEQDRAAALARQQGIFANQQELQRQKQEIAAGGLLGVAYNPRAGAGVAAEEARLQVEAAEAAQQRLHAENNLFEAKQKQMGAAEQLLRAEHDLRKLSTQDLQNQLKVAEDLAQKQGDILAQEKARLRGGQTDLALKTGPEQQLILNATRKLKEEGFEALTPPERDILQGSDLTSRFLREEADKAVQGGGERFDAVREITELSGGNRRVAAQEARAADAEARRVELQGAVTAQVTLDEQALAQAMVDKINPLIQGLIRDVVATLEQKVQQIRQDFVKQQVISGLAR